MNPDSSLIIQTYSFDPKALETHLKCLSDFEDLLYLVLLAILEFRGVGQRFEEENQLLSYLVTSQAPISEIYHYSGTTRLYLALQVRLIRHVQHRVKEVENVLPLLQEIVQDPHQYYDPFPQMTEADFPYSVTEKCLQGNRALCILLEEVRVFIHKIVCTLNSEFLFRSHGQTEVQTIFLEESRLSPVYRTLPASHPFCTISIVSLRRFAFKNSLVKPMSWIKLLFMKNGFFE